MTRDPFEGYLARLRRELRKRGVLDSRIVEETRGHLDDALTGARAEGLSDEVAARRTFDRFGEPAALADAFAMERFRMAHRLTLVAAAITGLLIAYLDARPGWDDAGVTAGALLLTAAVFAAISPQRPWLLGLAVGIWLPAHAIARSPSTGSFGMLIVLLFPLAGAYLGAVSRRTLTRA